MGKNKPSSNKNKAAPKKSHNADLLNARKAKLAALAPILPFAELYKSQKKCFSLINNLNNSFETGVLPSQQAYRCMLCGTCAVSIGAAARHYGVTREVFGCPQLGAWKEFVLQKEAAAGPQKNFKLVSAAAPVSVRNISRLFGTNLFFSELFSFFLFFFLCSEHLHLFPNIFRLFRTFPMFSEISIFFSNTSSCPSSCTGIFTFCSKHFNFVPNFFLFFILVRNTSSWSMSFIFCSEHCDFVPNFFPFFIFVPNTSSFSL